MRGVDLVSDLIGKQGLLGRETRVSA